MEYTSALIVATPAAPDPIREYSTADDLHITMLFFGEAEAITPDMAAGIREIVTGCAAQFDQFDVQVSGVALMGPDKMSVLLVESDVLADVRRTLSAEPLIRQAWSQAERQFPFFIPHLSVADDGQLPVDPPEVILIDALGFWMGENRLRYPFQRGDEAMMAAAFCIPTITCLNDLQTGLTYGESHPQARWYVEKRAVALGVADRIPVQWSGVGT